MGALWEKQVCTSWAPVLETRLMPLPPQSQQRRVRRSPGAAGAVSGALAATVTVSVMKRKAPDTRENGESKVTPRIPVSPGQAQEVSAWTVVCVRLQASCSQAAAPAARCRGHAQPRGPGREKAERGGEVLPGLAGSEGSNGTGSTDRDRAVATMAKEGTYFGGCWGPVRQERARQEILARAGPAVRNTETGCTGSTPKHGGRHSVL